jgi:hypothetical protein
MADHPRPRSPHLYPHWPEETPSWPERLADVLRRILIPGSGARPRLVPVPVPVSNPVAIRRR